MANKYVDFDGVMFDTVPIAFKKYEVLKKYGILLDGVKYIKKVSWQRILDESPEINDAIRILNSMPEAKILTRIHSMENEGVNKINFLRTKGCQNEIILAPYLVQKSEVVPAKGNLLIDDTVKNLDDWTKEGGEGIYFSKDLNPLDGWGITNTEYEMTNTLEILRRK